jgi:ribosome biogenesis GTPase
MSGEITEEQEGLVLASQGILATVELKSSGKSVRCSQIRGKEYAVVGDRVTIGPPLKEADEPRILSIAERVHVLRRQEGREEQIFASHVDRLVIVVAIEPRPAPGLIDRVLVAAEAEGIESILVINKVDLEGAAEVADDLSIYREIGYQIIETSAQEESGIDDFIATLGKGITALVGHSGVGKSSLINAILGDDHADTANISEATGRGRHTTTTAVAYRYQDGLIVDMPGIRSFSIGWLEPIDLRECFAEIRKIGEGCKFGDCLHCDEPGCAVVKAVADGTIHQERYDSYRKLLRELEEQQYSEKTYLKPRSFT